MVKQQKSKQILTQQSIVEYTEINIPFDGKPVH